MLKDIENIETIYIGSHINPDGDALGSALAMAMALKDLGKTPVVLLDKYDDKYNILKGREYIFNGDYSSLKPEAFIAVDCGSKERLGRAEEVFNKAELTYNIDHHISNTLFAKNNIVNGAASSASEVVYEVIKDFAAITKDIAEALYIGILTDTGGFMYSSTSKRTHQITGELVDKGIDTPFIHSKVLKEHTIEQVKIFNKALNNIVIDGSLAYSVVTDSEIKECKGYYSDLDGIVEYLLNIRGINISLLVSERENGIVKLSFRSKFHDVNKIAAAFGGGGHTLAAGASVKDRVVEEVVALAISEIKKQAGIYEK